MQKYWTRGSNWAFVPEQRGNSMGIAVFHRENRGRALVQYGSCAPFVARIALPPRSCALMEARICRGVLSGLSVS